MHKRDHRKIRTLNIDLEKAMKRREFIRATVGITFGTLPGMGVLIRAEENLQEGKVISTDDFPIPKKMMVVQEVLEGESVVLIAQNQQLKLNESGRLIWQHIDGKTCTDQLATMLVEEYGVEAKEAAVDVDLFITRLEKQGFLQVVDYSQRVTIQKTVQKQINPKNL